MQRGKNNGPRQIALVGNPNCGKTTLFNRLTGAHQRVGNWAGVTVERKEGVLDLGDRLTANLVDLPGVYSLEQAHMAEDEAVAADCLATEPFDLVINIVDATNLARNLVLTEQLRDRGLPLVVVLNMLDVAQGEGIVIDAVKLAARLEVPVLPVIASRGDGVSELLRILGERCRQPRPVDPPVATASIDGAVDGVGGVADNARMLRRYHRTQQLVSGVMEVSATAAPVSERIDRIVLNRWLGVPIFLAMMYLTFTVAINVGAVFIDFFDILFGAVLGDGVRYLLVQTGAPMWVTVLLADGVGGGITLVATFIPVIGFLFLCLSILEDSGYMARAAFVVDRLMHGVGLPGSAFVPLIVGFGCNVPSVMATRTLGRQSDRLLTIAMAPFMSCGARLTVYALFAVAFFPNNGQNVVFALYLLGIGMAVFTGWIFRRQIFGESRAPSVQEMPAYHVPVPRNIGLTTWYRLRDFVFRAGKTIVLVVIGLSFLNSFSTDGSFGHEDTESSVLATVGKAITPAFAPIGITEDNWPATVGLFTGVFAKEAVVGTLDALYSPNQPPASGPPDLMEAVSSALDSVATGLLGLTATLTDPLGIDSAGDGGGADPVKATTLGNMAALFGSDLAAFSYLVFILLYAPCVAVLGTMVKESGFRWMALVFFWSTGLGYAAATLCFQLGSIADVPLRSAAWIAGALGSVFVAVLCLRRIGRRAAPDLIAVVQTV